MSEINNTNFIDSTRLLYDKIKFEGVNKLTDIELLTVAALPYIPKSKLENMQAVNIIKEVIEKVGGEVSSLSTTSISELMRTAGISSKLAITLQAIVELASRVESKVETIEIVRNSEDVFQLLHRYIGKAESEEFWALYLSKSNRILECVKISQGGVSENIVDTRLVIKRGIDSLASKIIIAHNHPSGLLAPSDNDIALTTKIRKAAEFFDISLIDHVIITKESYYSFNDNSMDI